MADDPDRPKHVEVLIERTRHGFCSQIIHDTQGTRLRVMIDGWGVEIHPGEAIDVAEVLIKYAKLCSQVEMMRRKKLAFHDLVEQDGM